MGRPPIKKPSRRKPVLTLGRLFDKREDRLSKQIKQRKMEKNKPWKKGEE